MNQKIGTRLGVVIIIIIAITAAVFVWKTEKVNQSIYQPALIKQPITESQKLTSNEVEVASQNGEVTALIKDIYQKDAKYYIVLDYMTVRSNNYYLDLVSLDNTLRTYEIDPGALIQLIRYDENAHLESPTPIVKPDELFRILKNDGEDYYALNFFQKQDGYKGVYNRAYISPFYVKIEQGKLVKLEQIYQE